MCATIAGTVLVLYLYGSTATYEDRATSIVQEVSQSPEADSTQKKQQRSQIPETVPSPIGTGIKENILIMAMNANGDLQPRYHHNFQLVKLSTTLNKQHAAVFKDKNSTLVLIAIGPPHDLTLVQLRMSVEDFLFEKNGEVTGEGAAAFGRCVQRMTFAADPNWVGDLYHWMNQQMARALLTPEGVYITHKRFIANFGTFENEKDKTMVTMSIGALE